MGKNDKKIEKLINFLRNSQNLREDNYGNFLINNKTRYKLKKVVFCKQVKINNIWKNIWSVYYKDITIEKNKIHFKKIKME